MLDAKKIIATRWIEPDLEQYNGFFDHAWARATVEKIPAKLADAFDNLSLAWKEASNTHRMPWLLVHQMTAFAKGLMGSHKPHLARLIDEFKNWMISELDGALQRSEKKTIVASIKKIDQRLRLANQKRDFEFPAIAYWQEIITQSELQLSITGSQNLAYCGLVFAYEWFVVSCYRALGGSDDLRPSSQKFWTDYKTRLGGEPKAVYWEERPVRLGREVRNCIAHLGGKAKPDLLADRPTVLVTPEGILSVRPCDNRDLFAILKEKVSQLIAEAGPKL